MSTYEYNKKYADKYLGKLDTVTIRMEKGLKDEIKAHADNMGESLNSFINRAIKEARIRDIKKEPRD